ncbi:MAG: four helix bundle protein [Candidatus Kapabacteria bacterium]|nr:four helix bundle protein [Candidatus Kapabacteria bacterium]
MLGRLVRKLCHALAKGYPLDRPLLSQLLRCSTSVGANIREAKYAESRKDFIHKLKVAEKELAETYYWIGLLESEPSVLPPEIQEIEVCAQHVLKMLSRTIAKLRENSATPSN